MPTAVRTGAAAAASIPAETGSHLTSGLGDVTASVVTEKRTNACNTVEERRFSASVKLLDDRGLQPPWSHFCIGDEFFGNLFSHAVKPH